MGTKQNRDEFKTEAARQVIEHGRRYVKSRNNSGSVATRCTPGRGSTPRYRWNDRSTPGSLPRTVGCKPRWGA